MIHMKSSSLQANKSAKPNYKDDTKGRDMKIDIEIDFLDAIKSESAIKVSIVKDVVWKVCKGTRCDPKSGPNVWAEWGGRGFLLTNFGLKRICPKWNGSGHFVKQPWQACDGMGVKENVVVEEELKIPKGVKNNQKLRYTSKGHASRTYNGPSGDLLCTIIVKDHK